MIINSITLKNFRSYEDETTFSFAPKNEKNIVLIGGENGAGKSTLFEAIKLCIYGPTIYGYLGQNHNYLTKIKNNINDNAFKNEEVECFISLSLSFNKGTEIKEYALNRSWTYEDQKIHETFTVTLHGKELSDEEKLYFDKYLKSVIPPSLFDFFFFDGEELSDFFTGKNASSNLKESVLELFNYDTFEILKKQLLTYQKAKTKSNEKLEETRKNFDELSADCNNIKDEIKELENTLVLDEEHLDNLLVKRSNTEEDFRNSGGLLEGEKAALNSEIAKLESKRTDIYQSIKDFCNDTLPFLLVADILKDTKEQIEKDRTEVIDKFSKTSKIASKLKLLREKLNSTISDAILNSYLESLHSINEEINKIQNTLAVRKSTIERKYEDLKNKEYHLARARNEYTTLLQNINVLDMSNGLISYLDELLTNLTRDKIILIQDEFVKIFTTIIRKDNYINSIFIDDNFHFTLYINKEYFISDVINIINHLGLGAVTKKYGPKFIEDLLKHYNIKTNKELDDKMHTDISFDSISLSTKVNINDFSNGEKQIYILCLIWAIIKSSGVEIPFIIDTPYARIDETHRSSLTTTYLPNISNQVIILSTNKEIDRELYKVVKPYVCDEYLLLYNDNLRKTEVKNGYFEV